MTELLTQPEIRSSPSKQSIAQRWAIPLVLIGAVILFLGRVCLNFFAYWDDQEFIFRNPHVLGPTLGDLRWFWAHTQGLLYVPVTMDAFVLLARFSRLPNSDSFENPFDPAYFHAASLLTHVAAVLVVYTLLKFLFQKPWAACAGALLFALHPVQVEPLAWTCGLKDLLAGLFSLIAIWQYLLYTSANDSRLISERFNRRWIHLLIATAAIVVGELCKPSAMMAPIIAVALDCFLIGRPFKRVLISAWPLLLAAVPLAVVAKLVQPGSTGPDVPIHLRPLIATDAIAFYLYKLILPIHLAPDYGRNPHQALKQGYLAWTWIAPLAAAIFVIASRKKYPWVLAAGLVSLIALAPVLGLTSFSFESISTVADHYLYVAMLGPAIVLTALFRPDRPRWAAAVCTIVLLSLGIRSVFQIGYWRDDITLWQHAIAVTPEGGAAGVNLVVAEIRIAQNFGRLEDQRTDILKKQLGAKARPGTIQTDALLIKCKQQIRELSAQAEGRARSLIESHQDEQDWFVLHKAYVELGIALNFQHKNDQAQQVGYHLLQLELQRHDMDATEMASTRAMMGIVLLDAKDRNSEAANMLQSALLLDPTDKNAQIALDVARKRLANPSRQAAVDFAKAIEAGDMARVRAAAFGSDVEFTWVGIFSNWTVAYKHYQAASAKQFGKDSRFFVEDPETMVDQVEDADEKITGDTATLTSKSSDAQPIYVVRTGGIWKVDLHALWTDVDFATSGSRVKSMADIYTAMTADLQAGKFKTLADAQQELKRRIGEQLPPEYRLVNHGKATTLPSAS